MTTDKPLSETRPAPSEPNWSQPLAVTHPTLQSKFIETKWISQGEEWRKDYEDILKHVQSCTVDIAEHERIVNEKQEELQKLQQLYYKRGEEVERLKKELEFVKNCDTYLLGNNHGYSNGRDAGIAEGERRAMQRVNDIIIQNFDTRACSEDVYKAMRWLKNALSEEEKK